MIEYYLEECSKSEFDRLANCEETYFANGVIFEDETDNIICFPVYSNPTDEPDIYFKVLKRIKDV